jgi:prepilin-type N-terminal cleavage/methylation domain-containing protein
MRGKSRQHVVDSIQGKKSLSTVYRLLSTEKKSLPTTYCILPTEKGFTLVELLITMVIFVLVIAGASQIFTGLLTQFKQQSKIAETNIEGIVGLEILRQDIEHSGYGLPWLIPAGITYSEASGSPANTFNDASNAPRAIISGNNMTYSSPNNIFNGSDYLVIKAVNVARNDAAQKWTRLSSDGSKRNELSGSPSFADSGSSTDRVIVISPGSTDANSRSLSVSGTAFYTTYNNTSSFAPTDATETRIIYGVDPDTDLKMPFNRADYYIRKFDSNGKDIVPSRCATNTGVFEKVVVNQGDGRLTNFLPLLDCVADMQVIYQLDMNDDGTIGTQANADGSSVSSSEGATAATVQATLASASLLRQRLKEVRVYILAHEGQRDVNYTYPNSTIYVGDTGIGSGRNFNLTVITDYQNYRWKIYTIVVKPNNLSGEK